MMRHGWLTADDNISIWEGPWDPHETRGLLLRDTLFISTSGGGVQGVLFFVFVFLSSILFILSDCFMTMHADDWSLYNFVCW